MQGYSLVLGVSKDVLLPRLQDMNRKTFSFADERSNVLFSVATDLDIVIFHLKASKALHHGLLVDGGLAGLGRLAAHVDPSGDGCLG